MQSARPTRFLLVWPLLVSVVITTASCGGGGSSAQTPTPPSPSPTPTPSPTPIVEVIRANPDIPEGGVLVINKQPSAGFTEVQGWYNNEIVGTAKQVDVDHPTADKGIEIDVDNPTGQFWSAQAQIPITEAISQNDNLLLYVEIKMIESTNETGAGFVTAFIESPAPEFNKFLQFNLISTGEWESYFLPVSMPESYAANEIAVKFGFGAGDKTQTVQLANIQLFNYQNSKTLAQLPMTRPTYQGRDPQAAWRQAANERIEQHRKGNFTILVQDKDGNAIPDAIVNVSQTQHDYHFGSVATTRNLVGTDEDSQIYREKLLENFNQSGIENGLKWPAWVGEWSDNFAQEKTIEALGWLKSQKLYARGHVMIWPSQRNMPNFVQQYMPEDEPQNADRQVLAEVSAHIQDISGKTQGLLNEWDVLNEPYDNHYLMDAFGNNIMVEWFEQARSDNPSASLYINDYSILSGGGTNTEHQQHFYDTIAYLLDNNAPIDGIGMQSHFSATPTPITSVYTVLDRFATAYPNLDIRSTEFDVDTTDEEMQADYTRDFLTIFFSHPATVGIQKWGFWEGAHYRPTAAMYDINWRAKPNQQAWQDLVFNTWWSQYELSTDSSGNVTERGFYGHYKVDVFVGTELAATSTFYLGKTTNNTFTVIVD